MPYMRTEPEQTGYTGAEEMGMEGLLKRGQQSRRRRSGVGENGRISRREKATRVVAVQLLIWKLFEDGLAGVLLDVTQT